MTDTTFEPATAPQDTATLFEQVAQFSPSLKMFKDDTRSLKEFFQPVMDWSPSTQDFPYLAAYKDLLTKETARLYSKQDAEKLAAQMEQHPICETGTHLSFLHDTDGATTSYGFDNTLVLNRLINSAALYHDAGMSIHLGCRSSHVNVGNTNGSRFLQVYPHTPLYMVQSNKNANNLVRHAAALTQDDLKKLSQHYTQTIKSDPSKYNPAILQNMIDVFATHNNFADQTATVSSLQINQMLPDTVKDITLDDSALLKQLMVQSLRDPSSLFYTIFADDNIRTKFIADMANTRSGWKATDDFQQSPFSIVTTGGSKTQIMRAQISDFDHEPMTIANALEQGSLIPTCAMEFCFLLSQTGFVPHGGGFQHQYATEIQTKFSTFLDMIGAHDDAKNLRSLPLNNAVIPQGAGICIKQDGQQSLVNFSALLENPITTSELHNLVHTPVSDLFKISAPDVYNFFHINENKSAGNDPLQMPDHYFNTHATSKLIIR